ncbi:MAG: YceI family protein [Rhodocyclaceae bacterium]|nr:YceI family protein [Rhodocyclaceae bacterium]
MNVPTDGSFKRFKAQIALDPASPQTGSARIDVEPGSWDAGMAEINEEMLSKNWFDVKQYPTASFVSTGVKALGSDRYEARGKLSMKGRTRDVVATFTAKAQGTNLVLTGSFPLKRLDYGVGTGTWGDTDVVADEIQVKFQFVLAQGK